MSESMNQEANVLIKSRSHDLDDASAGQFHDTFALIIGINEYKSNDVHNLNGCVNDANLIYTFLRETHQVHDSHIVYLKNEAATREAIIGCIKSHLIKNDNIDTMILFSFTTLVMAAESLLRWGGILMTIKSKLSVLMTSTVIFDSCHSGGIARDPAAGNVRAIRNPAPILNKIDSDILASTSQSSQGGFRTAISSYVLLAACRQEESAREDLGSPCHGIFTASLHRALTESYGQRITYAKLMARVVSLCTGQIPQYEGAFNRFLLTLKHENVIEYDVTVSEDGKYTINAGRIHGVTKGTEFAVRPKGEPSVALLADKVGATLSTLVTSPEKGQPSFPNGTISVLSKFASDDAGLKVFVNSTRHPNLADGLRHLANTVYSSPARFLLWDQRPTADVEITQDSNGDFIIERLDSLTQKYSKPIFQPKIKDDLNALSSKLSVIAHFNYHLRRQHAGQMLCDVSNPTSDDPMTGVTLELHRLVEGEYMVDSHSLLFKNVACQTYDKDAQYAIGIRNHSSKALFPYVFSFDPSDYEIQLIYHPESPTMSPPLAVMDQNSNMKPFIIGPGPHGSGPINFTLLPEEQSATTVCRHAWNSDGQ
ncbi:hypothetical protein HETIRDRAFT_429511 [Heterobasidion irregulare TC 32-1]|uniref:Peptidase C14 caspase domain-containing protein n=1 Tax=Heterobasidion irregulare (strain TC 32-1) TaxID=747525 RepID=W4JUG7_HETIT|nr:uncharacterized protein HETIRDRAFT_429511 [Heterobasidion irregulare TC 32-1]ETW77198.1 hypothetical protein HETIRDRAFT_429511 [Heterobasidion irregulare TC 32-1]